MTEADIYDNDGTDRKNLIWQRSRLGSLRTTVQSANGHGTSEYFQPHFLIAYFP